MLVRSTAGIFIGFQKNKMTKLIILHAAGNEKIGVGHLSRVQSIALEIKKVVNANIYVLFEAPDKIAEQFAPSGVECFILKDRSESISKRTKIINSLNVDRSILITDLLGLNKDDAVFARSQGFTCLMHLNDSGITEYCPDVLVDGDAFSKKTSVANNKTVKLAGPRYHIIRPNILLKRPEKLFPINQANKLLLTFGGADPSYRTEFFLEYALRQNKYYYSFIIGPAFSEQRQEYFRKIKNDHISFIYSPNELSSLILSHDLIVTLGGLTSYEAMCLGKPVAAVEWSYMGFYVRELDKMGLLKNLGDESVSKNNLTKLLAEPHQLNNLAEQGWQCIDGKGSSRVAEYIRKLLYS